MRFRPLRGVLAGVVLLVAAGCGAAASTSNQGPSFPQGDAMAGAKLYTTTCATCHAANAAGTNGLAPSLLRLSDFKALYGTQSGLAAFIYENMPKTSPGSLTKAQAADLAAFIYGINGASGSATKAQLVAQMGKAPPPAPSSTGAPKSSGTPSGTPSSGTSSKTASGNVAQEIASGQKIFASTCSTCHGANGQGSVGPALWGSGGLVASGPYNTLPTLEQFVKQNMPLSKPGSLSTQQATDVSAYILNQNHIKP